MKLFSSTQVSWSEPWLFLLRIREGWAWRWRLLLALGIAVVMFLSIFFFGGGRLSLPGAIGISLASGVVLVASMDLSNLQRDVTVKDDCILVGTTLGKGWFETFKFDEILDIHLIRPPEWKWPWGGMMITTAKDGFLVAVPPKVSLDTLADVLHRLGAAVALAGWSPSETDTRIGIKNELELDRTTIPIQGEITIRPVEATEPRLTTPGHTAVQVAIALGPLLLALIGAVAGGVVLFRHWGVLTLWDKGLYGGGALLALILAFVYLVMVGQFVATSYGIGVARNRLPKRPNAMFTGAEDDLACVEIFDRESWTAMLSKASDFGFLQLDRPRSRLLFEGNKFRWTLPLAALTACRIEEAVVGSEGNPDAERRYYVVIAAPRDGAQWEAGMIYARTEIGSDTAESRYQRAQRLFTQLADAVKPR